MKRFFCLLLGLPVWAYAQPRCWATDLQTEHLCSPMGIDARQPRFSWQMQDDRAGAYQRAYEICVSMDSLEVAKGIAGIWQVKPSNTSSQLITYAGPALKPFTRYYWAVRLWDKDNHPGGYSVAAFETGMVQPSDWKGSWISDSRDIHQKAAAYFRRVFTTNKKIISARAYIAVAGLYELYINGQRIGDHRLDPMYTRFDRRTLYVTYDVTAALQNGNNAVGILLGNGWYNHQSTAVWYFDKAPWRNRPTFCMDLRITYKDGTTQTIVTNREWKTSLSPVIFNSIYTAEHYDARLEQPGWNNINFMDTAWKNSICRSAPSTHIAAQALQPIRTVETINTKSLNKFSDTDYVFNIGRNIAGVSQLTVTGNRGTIIQLKHGERLYKNGHVDQSNIDVHYRPTDDSDPFQTDIFILKGGRAETFEPRFNYKGFQYIEVTSDRPITLTENSLVAKFLHSDVSPTGTLKSSNPIINQIAYATNNSYLSNLFGYPTDCPQREKNGWTGDAQIAIETGLYNFDGITIYEKWMADHRDEQQPNGVLPAIIPSDGWGYAWGNGPDWTSTIAVIPWNLYLFYGDSKSLSDCYDNIKSYVDYIDNLFPTGLTSWGLGDWVPVKSETPVELTSTCYYFADAIILAKAAKLFNKQNDCIKYTALAKKIQTAFNNKYLDTTTYIYANGLQTELSVPLFWGIVPGNMKAKVAASLAKRVQADSAKLDLGLLGSKAILSALSDNGYANLAYQLAAREQYPSWGWWMKNGATTLYENWNIQAPRDISLNHIMFGAIGGWFYRGLGGIAPDPSRPGFKHILLHPNFVEGLDSFSCTHQCLYGEIRSSWKRVGHRVKYTCTVPANATATLMINHLRKRLVAGTYQLTVQAP